MSRGKCLKYLKSGGNRKEGRRNQNFKRGRQAESRSGHLKKGAGTPLKNCGTLASQVAGPKYWSLLASFISKCLNS